MFNRNNEKTGRQGGKRRRLPVFSIVLVLCYLVVFIWFLINGFGKGEQDLDEDPNEPVAVTSFVTPDMELLYITPPDTDVKTDEDPPPAVKVKGLYVSAWRAGMADRMDRFMELCETTEINALVIDVKDDLGQITFITETQGLSGTSTFIIPDIDRLVLNMKNRGIYTIARVVCFKDPAWSSKHPQYAIQTSWGELWEDRGGVSWLDPYKTEVWDYLAAVCMEAARVGFDEVQLDYVRFPADGRLSDISYGTAGEEKTKPEIINEFVLYIRDMLAEKNVRLSADVFGIIAISNRDAQIIGQDLSLLLHSMDSICPMIYPSHFANKNQNGIGQIINGVLFEAPDLEPYEVVYNILLEFKRHLDADSDNAIIRPYLQDFTASYLGDDYYQDYNAAQVLEQIKAVNDAGFDEWILWNHISVYSEDAFE